jgi:aspartyl-tRNA(Asn)/glutamyl-tRNA(Gln) amidotransferase subunit A
LTNDELSNLDAVRIAHAVRTRELSAIDVVKAALARMDALEPSVHAFCTATPELALEQAEAVERIVMAGGDPGPLAGVPFGIKDLISAAGIRMTGGAPAYENFIADEDDVAVERMKQAGAIVIGKTNVPEFGYSGVGHNPIFETTRNPWNLAMTPGGSSAGSAAAVVSGMCPIALGSDGGGSVRIPAAHSGIFGMKASMGRVPLYPGCRDELYPGFSGWESLEHIGPLTRTVADAALMLSVISGPDERDRLSLPAADFDWKEALHGGIRGLRVAYSPDWGYAPVDPEVREVVGRAVKVFEQELGCTVEIAHPGFTDPFAAFWALVAQETDLVGMRKIVEQHGDRMSRHLVEMIMHPWTAEDFTNANLKRKEVTNRMWRFMRDYDLILTPTLAVPPFPVHIQGPEKIDGRMVSTTQWLAFTFPLNMTGQPAASVPAGFTSDGLPVGMQIIGRHLADATVLRAAAAFEAAQPWRHVQPPVVANLIAHPAAGT